MSGSDDNRADARTRYAVICILAVHVACVGYSATVQSPTYGEVPAMASGVWHWTTANFDLFRVNPPLVRMVATATVLALQPATDWSHVADRFGYRCAFDVGADFIRANSGRSMWLFTVARWSCIPFTLLGAIVCYLWSRDLYGSRAGLVALTLWCASPNLAGHAQLITADAAAASCGVLAGYSFWKWLIQPTGSRTFAAGIALGIVLLVKTTWLVLLGLWPVLWILWTLSKSDRSKRARGSELLKLTAIVVTGLTCVNLGYGAERAFVPLGQFRFVSRTLGGAVPADVRLQSGANRFRGTWAEGIPSPFPENYLLGIDIQRRDFEVGQRSYMRGSWRTGGRWYYYIYACLVKVPEGTLVLLLMATVYSIAGGRRVSFRDEALLLLPAIAVFALVSSQTGINSHFRYVLPAFPFLLIFTGQLGSVDVRQRPLLALTAVLGLSAAVMSSVLSYPHHLSYCNALAPAPTKGAPALLGSNIDWGQDVLFLREWYRKEAHPEPISLALATGSSPQVGGFSDLEPPADPRWRFRSEHMDDHELGPRPGLYAISINRLYGYDNQYRYFLEYEPIHVVSRSIYVYRISLDGANRVRRKLDLPLVHE